MNTTSGLPKIPAPALRALASRNIESLRQLETITEAELLALHGFGPKALRIVKEALALQGRTLKRG